MNRLTLFIVVFAIIITVFTLIFLVFLRTTSVSPTPPPSPTPTRTTIPIPTYPTTDTIQSSGVKIKNPFVGAKEFTTQGDALTDKTDTYSIVYLRQFDEFIITVDAEPFESNRLAAELNFIERLGVTQQDACRLNVSISPPKKEDSLTPRYKLSFCQ